MTHDEVVKVLARVQMDDNRQVDRVVVNSWVEEIGDLDYELALEAVIMHRRETTAWLMAAHVRENVRRIRYMRDRDDRVNNPRQIEPNKVTLDRAEFERLTNIAIAEARAERRHRVEITRR